MLLSTRYSLYDCSSYTMLDVRSVVRRPEHCPAQCEIERFESLEHVPSSLHRLPNVSRLFGRFPTSIGHLGARGARRGEAGGPRTPEGVSQGHETLVSRECRESGGRTRTRRAGAGASRERERECGTRTRVAPSQPQRFAQPQIEHSRQCKRISCTVQPVGIPIAINYGTSAPVGVALRWILERCPAFILFAVFRSSG